MYELIITKLDNIHFNFDLYNYYCHFIQFKLYNIHFNILFLKYTIIVLLFLLCTMYFKIHIQVGGINSVRRNRCAIL